MDRRKYMSIIDFLQEAVDEISREEFKHDDCPPEFTVSVLYEEGMHRIILTVKHLGRDLSEPLFPNFSQTYGYESLRDDINYLYNRTM